MENLLNAIKTELQCLDAAKLKDLSARFNVKYSADGSAEVMIDNEIVAVCGRSRIGY
ncbi:hypothetical protein HWV01_14415 [Moritella sp. 5]|uniref:hypothetical protein n=1 Tax=Moritella sp. 5 TaxID=2746231 RepID=UPI001BA45D16|nr:hypothetical protein [Moritella sp. 5]QUM81394.1 hypothetical protein HWV01_14415 [Moritella sp. 5]